MNHKILEKIKGGGFLAGDLPMSTSSLIYLEFMRMIHDTVNSKLGSSQCSEPKRSRLT
jgi:hypothetical protein